MRKINILGVMAVSVLLLNSMQPANAMLKASEVPQLDFKVKMTKDEYTAKSELIEETPQDDKALSFKIRLPKNWIRLPSPKTEGETLSAEIFKEVAVFLSPPRLDTRSRFRMRALDLKHMVSAENWFMNYLLSNGSTVDGLLVRSDRRIEAEYTVLEGGETYTTRAVAEITGGQIVLAEYMVPIQYAEEEREDQVWSMAMFMMTDPDIGAIEATDTYAFIDIVKFEYPQSWILYSPPISSIDRMQASVVNVKGIKKEDIATLDFDNLRLDGRINVNVISKYAGTTEKAEIDSLRLGLKERGLEIGEFIAPFKGVTLHKGILKSKIDSYKINSIGGKMARYEFWVAILESKGRYYIIDMISVGRDAKFYTWAQNVATFKYILETLSPVNDTN